MAKRTIPAEKWKWYGYAGHFIAGSKCAYHLSTRIGKYLVSTLGDYHDRSGERQTIGAGEGLFYETMIFHCRGEAKTGDAIIGSWSSVDGERYATSLEAERGHYRYCKKFARLPQPKHRSAS